ncbi:hypothetical protein T492DRAFT_1125843 [Pavlovales sp. CCMP2436]|nr:hypothetical protein T492DRAFT_1125843 [Pavlovales sp. CCMP2436]
MTTRYFTGLQTAYVKPTTGTTVDSIGAADRQWTGVYTSNLLADYVVVPNSKRIKTSSGPFATIGDQFDAVNVTTTSIANTLLAATTNITTQTARTDSLVAQVTADSKRITVTELSITALDSRITSASTSVAADKATTLATFAMQQASINSAVTSININAASIAAASTSVAADKATTLATFATQQASINSAAASIAAASTSVAADKATTLATFAMQQASINSAVTSINITRRASRRLARAWPRTRPPPSLPLPRSRRASIARRLASRRLARACSRTRPTEHLRHWPRVYAELQHPDQCHA